MTVSDPLRVASVNLGRATRNAHRAQTRATSARDDLYNAVRAAVAAGMSEVEVARRTGLARMTIRKHLGK